jgi:hypothetical protein
MRGKFTSRAAGLRYELRAYGGVGWPLERSKSRWLRVPATKRPRCPNRDGEAFLLPGVGE